MRIYEKDTHEAKYLFVENGEQFTALEGHLIENIDNHYILRLNAPITQDGIFRFDVTSCDSFSAYLINRKLSRAELISFLAQLKSVITTMEDHMLGDANILLEPEHMYIDKNNRKIRFVPVCKSREDFSERLRKLTGELFLHADLEDMDSLRFAAMMMQTSLKENVRLHDLMQLVDTRRIEVPGKTERDGGRRPAREEGADDGRTPERYQGSSIIVSHPQEELTTRLSDEEQEACRRMLRDSGDLTTEKEESGGIRGFFSEISRKFRDRIDDEG